VVGGEGDGDGLVVVAVVGVFDAVLTVGGFGDAEVDEFVDEVRVVGEVEAMCAEEGEEGRMDSWARCSR